jgi:hypothetical protein
MDLGSSIVTIICIASIIGIGSILVSIFVDKDFIVTKKQITTEEYLNKDIKYYQYKNYGIVLDDE